MSDIAPPLRAGAEYGTGRCTRTAPATARNSPVEPIRELALCALAGLGRAAAASDVRSVPRPSRYRQPGPRRADRSVIQRRARRCSGCAFGAPLAVENRRCVRKCWPGGTGAVRH